MKKLLRDSNGPAPLKDLEQRNSTTKEPLTKNDQRHVDKDHEEEEEEEEEDDEDDVAQRPPARNLFALLDEGDQDDDNTESEEESKASEIVIPATTTTSSSKKKKNKKKKSGATSAAANPFDALKDDNEDDNEDNTGVKITNSTSEQPEDPESSKSKKNKKKKKGKSIVKSVEEMSVEEFEKSLQQMNKQLGSVASGAGSSQQPATTPLKQLLAVDTRFLDADAEMKKMFGARVVNSEIKDRRYAKAIKKSLLAQPRATWPVRKASGLSMEIVGTDEKENVTTFKVVHSEYYQKTQLKFLAAVASYDPNNLVALLRESPFHIDSLLQLSEVSKHNGDNSLAGELIEQALFAFEKSFHSLFNIASGSVRLSFMEVENRSFFLAIHRHIQFLGRRGCWRTAFEFNKLLLSLDPTHDELGSLVSIDFYALKAQEYTYLLRLFERLNKDHGLDRLPNFVYSTALAQFHLETQQGDSAHTESSKALQRAILMFPTTVLLLADQGSFSVDAEVAGEAAFYPASDLPKAFDLYIHLFALRNFALWKEPEVISWLKSNIKICTQSRFNNKNDPDLKDATKLLAEFKSAESSKSPILSYSPDGTLDSDAFTSSPEPSQGVTLRVCRHVLVSEYNSLARYLPQNIVTAPMHMHDPLPPPGSRNVYEVRFEAQRSSEGLMGGARDAAQIVLEGVVRRLREDGVAGFGGVAELGELQEEQLRQITEAVELLRARRQGHQGHQGALPGAFPDQGGPVTEETVAAAGAEAIEESQEGDDALDAEVEELLAADSAGQTSMFQSLTDMIRRFGFRNGQATEDNDEPSEMTPETAQELLLRYQDGDEYEDEEGEEDEYMEDEDQPFGSDGDDGWEPYDPAAYE
ncbi:Transcription factor 25 [Entomortierella lignicola]|nr:Transcription factor 25 [Entomortierella lignicola]